MPIPTDELQSDTPSETSSCLHDQEEGTARKPNVFGNYQTLPHSEKKTAVGSEHFENFEGYTPNKEVKGVEINSSWEVVEESSIVIEVEDGFGDSKGTLNDRETLERPDVTKSDDSKTATFASRVNGVKIEESKTVQESHRKEGPFRYNDLNSEEDDFDSEEEISMHSFKESHHGSQWMTSQKVNSVMPQDADHISPESSSKKATDKQNEKDEGWIGGKMEKMDTQSVNDNVMAKMNESGSSNKFESMSTHTSPQFQAQKLIRKKEVRRKRKDEYVDKNQFGKFIKEAKKETSNKLSSKGRPWRSPLKIVDRLVEDANKRLRNKEKMEPKGHGPAFSKTFKNWNSTLRNNRNKSAQPVRERITAKFRSESSYRSDGSGYRSVGTSQR